MPLSQGHYFKIPEAVSGREDKDLYVHNTKTKDRKCTSGSKTLFEVLSMERVEFKNSIRKETLSSTQTEGQ